MIALDLPAQGLGRLSAGVGGVDQHQIGLARGLHIGNGPALGLDIVLPGNVGDGAVGGHDNPDGAVLLHDLLCAQLGGLLHGQGLRIPGRGDHPGLSLLLRPQGSGDQIAHRVDEPYRQLGRPVRRDGHRVLGDELGLGCHNGPAGPALGQLIPGPLPLVHVFNMGDDQGLHHPFDKGGLARADRSHHADINIPAGALGHIPI